MKKFSGFDGFIYYSFCILTFGMLYVYKVTMKKALDEMKESQ